MEKRIEVYRVDIWEAIKWELAHDTLYDTIVYQAWERAIKAGLPEGEVELSIQGNAFVCYLKSQKE
jgi:hypothetical protein